MAKKVWGSKDRHSTYISTEKPYWDKIHEVWEFTTSEFIEVPRNFIPGLKMNHRSILIFQPGQAPILKEKK